MGWMMYEGRLVFSGEHATIKATSILPLKFLETEEECKAADYSNCKTLQKKVLTVMNLSQSDYRSLRQYMTSWVSSSAGMV